MPNVDESIDPATGLPLAIDRRTGRADRAVDKCTGRVIIGGGTAGKTSPAILKGLKSCSPAPTKRPFG